MFCRGSDQGGGVGGVNYTEYSDGSELNYKFYNLRGDVVLTLSEDNTIKSKDRYFAFGEHISRGGDIKTDMHRANTKVEDSGNLLNEGKRFRQLEYGIFLTPDPLEYVDGYNPYIYCGQNPWGKWDPLGLRWTISNIDNGPSIGEPNIDISRNQINPYITIEIWVKYSGSSDRELKSRKSYFIAIEVNFYKNCDSCDNPTQSRVFLREAKINSKTNTVENQEIKGFLQDPENLVDVIGKNDKSLKITMKVGIYEGDIARMATEKSNVRVGIANGPLAANQTKDMWDMYAQSEVGNENAYKTASKTLKEFEELNKIKSLDTSGEFGVEFNVKDCSRSEIGDISNETKKGRGGKAH